MFRDWLVLDWLNEVTTEDYVLKRRTLISSSQMHSDTGTYPQEHLPFNWKEITVLLVNRSLADVLAA